jgi:hypothetical protein
MSARLIRPSWSGPRVAQVLIPKPTQKTEYQKSEYGE